MFAGHQRLFRLTSGLAPGKIATELSGDRLLPPCGVDHFRQSASPGLLLLLTPEMFGRPLARGSRRGHSEKDASPQGTPVLIREAVEAEDARSPDSYFISRRCLMTKLHVGLDVSQKTVTTCFVLDDGNEPCKGFSFQLRQASQAR
jgi:hypothetical protein